MAALSKPVAVKPANAKQFKDDQTKIDEVNTYPAKSAPVKWALAFVDKDEPTISNISFFNRGGSPEAAAKSFRKAYKSGIGKMERFNHAVHFDRAVVDLGKIAVVSCSSSEERIEVEKVKVTLTLTPRLLQTTDPNFEPFSATKTDILSRMLDNMLTDALHKPHRVKKMDAARFFDRYAPLDIETEDTAPQYVLLVSWKHNEGAFKVAAGAVWFLGMVAHIAFYTIPNFIPAF